MKLGYETDDGLGTRASLGLVVLQADETIEAEFRRFLDIDGVSLATSRIPSGRDVTPDTLKRMEAELPTAVDLLPPTVRFDAIGYACTSGAAVIGEAKVADIIRHVRPGTAVSDPVTAVRDACWALGVRRLGFVTPYVAEVSAAIRAKLEVDGVTIAGFGSFEQSEEGVVARIKPHSTLRAIAAVAEIEPCDAVFVSCTNLRVAGILEEAEALIGRPVISSNQALAWHMLRKAGIPDTREGFGELFRRRLS
ncbi:aspartate/glutamate racemase family protein [Rhizobiales bacterium]|uniref:maleate cis-trans isomerase family protein n=1 Tax=Hongsoonwoonella zoysiae TaxID=2821844 RepID=UPI00155FF757|nr:aspartate/glutamate racemase family protein [Hongsoonwoonella zoysiae]NRG18528.1 aspartate/glutamate racemase family protein [Hongsoonwoonella zoysiae]